MVADYRKITRFFTRFRHGYPLKRAILSPLVLLWKIFHIFRFQQFTLTFRLQVGTLAASIAPYL